MLYLLNEKTGEKFDITLPKPAIKEMIDNMTDDAKAFYFPQLNFARRLIAEFESNIKSYIKSQPLEFDENRKSEWMGIRISKTFRYDFDKDKFEREATESEKKTIARFAKLEEKVNQIKEKYKTGKPILKI